MNIFFAGSDEARCFPSDDVLILEGKQLLQKMRGYDPSFVPTEDLVQLAKDRRTGAIVSSPTFLRGVNGQRRPLRHKPV